MRKAETHLFFGQLDLVRVHVHKRTNDSLLAFPIHGLHRENRTVPGGQERRNEMVS